MQQAHYTRRPVSHTSGSVPGTHTLRGTPESPRLNAGYPQFLSTGNESVDKFPAQDDTEMNWTSHLSSWTPFSEGFP